MERRKYWRSTISLNIKDSFEGKLGFGFETQARITSSIDVTSTASEIENAATSVARCCTATLSTSSHPRILIRSLRPILFGNPFQATIPSLRVAFHIQLSIRSVHTTTKRKGSMKIASQIRPSTCIGRCSGSWAAFVRILAS